MLPKTLLSTALGALLLSGTLAAADAKPTAADAKTFVDAAESRLARLSTDAQRAQWVQSTFITDDTEIIAAQANEQLIGAGVEIAKGATRFDGLELPADMARKLTLLKLGLVLPAPSDPAETAEVARLAATLEGDFGKGKYCPPGKECQSLGELSGILAGSRDPNALLEAWKGWHSISPPMRKDYARLVELANQGARDLGFKDVGAMWRSKYDMPPDAFAAELDRLWGQVRPLYESLHCYVRGRLAETYGPNVVSKTGPIPAHLLGNMWAQDWGNIYPLVAPKTQSAGFDLTERLRAKKLDAKGMVRYGEAFFSSLGFAPLPETFWQRSLFVQPRDRDVVCHASAWDIDGDNDLRIKMCIGINDVDFRTIHHELGHNYYQRAYNQLPFLFRDSANDGFHEGIGDTIALSITPKYLKQLGLIEQEPDLSQDIPLLLRKALEKVAFLPFGLLIDQWRWKVYSGEVTPANYNQAWWELRRKYQGIVPPVQRSEADFDPGAKYHVPANVPYTRYFLADILQFQFHRALCKAAGESGPLNRCSIYGNKAAGERLQKMLAMGASQPWPDALAALSGERQMDATAMLDYFAPLKTWLDEQNKGQQCGW
ncbi:MAG: M2 family metallopeptidase [Acidobacteriota bacterium]